MKILTLTVFPFALAFAGEKYGVYDSQGNRVSAFEAERHELPEKARQIKSDYPNKAVYVSSLQKGKGSKPSSQYRFKTGSYIEATRKETFAICPPDKKTEGTWISEYSVYLNAENCLSVQTPDLAGTIDVLFMEGSGKTDTIQILVDQSYIQMGDYSHKIWVFDPMVLKPSPPGSMPIPDKMLINVGKYESRNYKQNLIVDKTKFIAADAWRYSKIDSSVSPFNVYGLPLQYENVNLEESRLPLVPESGTTWRIANLRSKMEDLDTVYVILSAKDARKFRDTGKLLFEEGYHKYINDDDYPYPVLGMDTSASGYRVPSAEEYFFLMRAGASTRYYWGDEEDSLTVSRYAWFPLKEDPFICRPFGTDPNTRVCEYPPKKSQPIRSVAQLIPNQFGLYDMFGLAAEGCFRNGRFDRMVAPECYYVGKETNGSDLTGFRLLRKTPKLHKLEKF